MRYSIFTKNIIFLLLIYSCADRVIFTDPGSDPGLGGSYSRISGFVSGTLKKDDSPFLVIDDLFIDGNDTLIIENNMHPITNIYEKGQEVIVTKSNVAQLSGPTTDELAPIATELAWAGLKADPRRWIIAVCNIGATGFAGIPPTGADPTPERRALFGFNEKVHVFDNDSDGIENIALT